MAARARTFGKMAAPPRMQAADDTRRIMRSRSSRPSIGHRVECSVHLPVHNKIIRSVVFAILLFAIGALVRVWPYKSAKDATSFTPADKPRQLAASTSTVQATPVMPAAPVARGTAVSGTPAGLQGVPVQIDVRTPATLQSGESLQVTVDLEANGGIRQLAFSVTYNQSVLQLLGFPRARSSDKGALPPSSVLRSQATATSS